jgi:NAD-dependent deacetylase sirtuin 4
MQAASKSVKSMFVPAARSINEYDLKAFSMFLNRNESLFCLTGAGISTESGIPDYRSKGVGLYDRENHKPITHQEFTRSAHKRQRY